MKVKEYIEAAGVNENKRLMFIIGDGSKYRTSSIRSVWEWLMEGSSVKDYIVLNPSQPPVATITTNHWLRNFNEGSLLCMFVMPEAAIRAQYSQRQAEQVLAMYDKEVKATLNG